MNNISNTFSAIVWFLLCLLMVFGMIGFAVLYAVLAFILKYVGWKKNVSFSFPNIKFAK